MKTISKISAIALVAIALVGVNTASAATVAELQAMIASLSAQIAALSGTTSTPSAVTFTSNLTVGSKGAEVTALQNFLIGKGYNTMATGFFGPMTKAALAAYQTAKGITPAVGYFGPLTRTSVNGEAVTTTTTTTGVTTKGVEGTISATEAAISNSTIYEGDTKAPVLAIKVKAQTSDMKVERIKIDLGATSDIYNKDYKTIYALDESGNVLASSPLNSDTVVKDSGEYYITLTGMNYVISKGSSKNLTIAVDVYSSVKLAGSVSTEIKLVTDAIRATDGAGMDQYAGSASIANTVSIATVLSDSASLKISTDSATPKTAELIASAGSANDEADKVTVLTFDVRAEKDNVIVTDILASTTVTTTATLSNAYLYDGSTLLASGAVVAGTVSFTDISNLVVSKDTTKVLTIKVDIRTAAAAADTITSAILANGISAETSSGSNLTSGSTITGSATGNTLTVRKAGPVITLVGTPVVGSVAKNTDTAGNATSTMPVTFNLNITAQGADVTLGDSASTTPFVNKYGFSTYVDGAIAYTGVIASTTVWSVPSSGVVYDSANGTFVLQQGNTVSIPVTVNLSVAGATAGAHSYAIGLKKLSWFTTAGADTSTFMAGDLNWRSSNVPLP